MAVRLREVERAYFVRKAGGAVPTEPLNNIKRRYMAGVVGAGVTPQTQLEQLEKLWLVKTIGGAATNFNSIEELWRQAVIAISKTPVPQNSQNKITFYVNAP